MTVDTAYAALVDANPIPDPVAYARNGVPDVASLSLTSERSSVMQTVERSVPPATPQRRFRIAVALAIVLAVVAAGVALTLVLRQGSEVADEPPTSFATAEEAAVAYLGILHSGDWEAHQAALGSVGTDYVLRGLGAEPEAVERRLTAMAAEGFQGEVVSCLETSGMAVACRFVTTGGIDHSLYGEVQREMIVSLDADGSIGRVTFMGDPADGGSRLGDFIGWMEVNHPELSAELDELWSATEADPDARAAEDIVADQLDRLEEFLAQNP